MALIDCPECSHQVSDRAASCPNCGFPLEGQRVEAPPDADSGDLTALAEGGEDGHPKRRGCLLPILVGATAFAGVVWLMPEFPCAGYPGDDLMQIQERLLIEANDSYGRDRLVLDFLKYKAAGCTIADGESQSRTQDTVLVSTAVVIVLFTLAYRYWPSQTRQDPSDPSPADTTTAPPEQSDEAPAAPPEEEARRPRTRREKVWFWLAWITWLIPIALLLYLAYSMLSYFQSN